MKTSFEYCVKSASCTLQYDEQRIQCPILNADNEPLHYRNSEGYSDPTAFFALRSVMRPGRAKRNPKTVKKQRSRTQVIHYD